MPLPVAVKVDMRHLQGQFRTLRFPRGARRGYRQQ